MVMTDFGGPEVLEIQDRPMPEPGANDLLVKVEAAGVNPVDIKTRNAPRWGDRRPPMILGYDVCGQVVECGHAVEGLQPGDRIMASPSLLRDGAYAEYVVVDYRTAAVAPTSLSSQACAAIPLATITAWEALYHHARLKQGQTVLIHAGAGGVGHLAIQLARHSGCRTLTTAGRPESLELCRQVGADAIIDYTQGDVVEQILSLTGGKGCDVVLDTVGGEVFNQSIACLADYGHLSTIVPGVPGDQINTLFGKNGSIHFEFMGGAVMKDHHPENNGRILRQAAELVDAGKLKPHVMKLYSLEEIADAHRQVESGRTTGKCIIALSQ
jgi:NADPH2:quinone reductase